MAVPLVLLAMEAGKMAVSPVTYLVRLASEGLLLSTQKLVLFIHSVKNAYAASFAALSVPGNSYGTP